MSARIIYLLIAVSILAIAVAVNSLGKVVYFVGNLWVGQQVTVYGWPFVMCGVTSEFQFVDGVPADYFGAPHYTPDLRLTITLFGHPHLSSYIALIPAAFNFTWWCACGGLLISLAGRWKEQGGRVPRYSLAHLILLQGLIAAAVAGHFSFR